MKIKYGITQWSLPGKGINAIKYASEVGFDGLQIELGSYSEGYYMTQERIQFDYMNDAAKYGIAFPSIVLNDLCVHGFVDRSNKEGFNEAINSLYLSLDVAISMNIDTIVIPQFLANEITNDEGLKTSASVMKMICEEAAENGIHIESETTLSPEKQIELINTVAMPNLTTFYDSQNYYFYKGYNQKDIIEALYPYMGKQLHVKDGFGQNTSGGVLSGALLGKGDSNIMATIDYLLKKSYSGWIIVENYYYIKPLRDVNKDQFELIKEDLNFLQAIFIKT